MCWTTKKNEGSWGGAVSLVTSGGIFIDRNSTTFYCSAINYSADDEKCRDGCEVD